MGGSPLAIVRRAAWLAGVVLMCRFGGISLEIAAKTDLLVMYLLHRK